MSLGAEVMEVMVYRKRERRKYSPLTTDNNVFYVTGSDDPHMLSLYNFVYRISVKGTNGVNNSSLPYTHSLR